MRLTGRIRRLPLELKIVVFLLIAWSVPFLGNYMAEALGFAIAGTGLVLYLCVVALPVVGLAWFAYHAFLGKILRARHIQRIRLYREIREADARAASQK